LLLEVDAELLELDELLEFVEPVELLDPLEFAAIGITFECIPWIFIGVLSLLYLSLNAQPSP
jgi:hypothetical protein